MFLDFNVGNDVFNEKIANTPYFSLLIAISERVSTSEQTQLKFSPCFFSDYKLAFAAKTELQSIPKGANRFNLLLGRAKRA